ncbi:hypothetical protein CVT24_011849 [Panaeolus cyanescens]|uniref:JmjC domain-containing protein n=1 Tax=Panaeolus cyanescens TaxID=181874 RepID=A0A409YP24_9AGAR|nr:hypothetical protein CVT24_011849 [Panaeolus cyanescens]
MRSTEESMWNTLTRVAAKEVGLVKGVREFVQKLPLEAISAQTVVDRQWFNLGFINDTLQPSRTDVARHDVEAGEDNSLVPYDILAFDLQKGKVQHCLSINDRVASQLEKWQEAIQNHCKDGKPMYCVDPDHSMFLLCGTRRQFMNQIAPQVILTKKHIILVDDELAATDRTEFKFDRRTISRLYPTTSKIPLTDHTTYPPLTLNGTLRDLIGNDTNSEMTGSIFSSERLPLHEGRSELCSLISDDNAAWRATKGRFFCPPDELFPYSHTRGAYVSMEGTVNGLQIPIDGSAMVLNVKCGALWVIVGSPVFEDSGFRVSSFASVRTFADAEGMLQDSHWAHEAVLVSPGIDLIIRPNTPFATVALEDVCYTVENFYVTGTLVETFAGLAHTLCSSHISKSTSTSSSCLILQRFIIFLHAAFVQSDIDPDEFSHILDIGTPEGCSNFLAACAIAIMLDIFNASSYSERHAVYLASPQSNGGGDRYHYVRELGYELVKWLFARHTVVIRRESNTFPRSSRGIQDVSMAREAPYSPKVFLQSVGECMAGILHAATSTNGNENPSYKVSPMLLKDSVDVMIDHVFPRGHEDGGIVRLAYEKTLGALTMRANGQWPDTHLDFMRQNWIVKRKYNAPIFKSQVVQRWSAENPEELDFEEEENLKVVENTVPKGSNPKIDSYTAFWRAFNHSTGSTL